MALVTRRAIGRRVRALEGEDAVVVEVPGLPVSGRVTATAVVRVVELPMGRRVRVAVLYVAIEATSSRVRDQIVLVTVGATWPIRRRGRVGTVERKGGVVVEARPRPWGGDRVARLALGRHDLVARVLAIGAHLVVLVAVQALGGLPIHDAHGVASAAGLVVVAPI